MPLIGVEFEAEHSEAVERASSGNGAVLPNGNYYREEVVNQTVFNALRNCAEDDPEASITRVEL